MLSCGILRPPDFIGFYLPPLLGFTRSWWGAGYMFNPMSRFAVPLHSTQPVWHVVRRSFLPTKCPKAVPSMEQWGLLQVYCTHRGGLHFEWVSFFVHTGALCHPMPPWLCSTSPFSALSILTWWEGEPAAASAFPAGLRARPLGAQRSHVSHARA